MKIENLDINLLVPYDKNPRNISDDAVDVVAKSIEKFGFNQPIMVDQNNRICVGHTRFCAAKKLKLKVVPVLKKKMTDAEFTAYNIADNKTGEFSSWNRPLLLENWEKLESFPELRDATALEKWEIEPPAEGKRGEGGTKETKYNEKITAIELVYPNDKAKELRDLCNRLDPDAAIEETIMWCVQEMIKKADENATA